MQRVWNFPMGTKQGCPQDRESSGHVGIHVKKCTRNFLVCKQTLLPRGVCVHICISASTNSHFAMYYKIWDSGRVGKTREKEITASTLVVRSLAFHISTGQSPQWTLLLPVMMGREEMETVRVHIPFCHLSSFWDSRSASMGQIPSTCPRLLPWSTPTFFQLPN